MGSLRQTLENSVYLYSKDSVHYPLIFNGPNFSVGFAIYKKDSPQKGPKEGFVMMTHTKGFQGRLSWLLAILFLYPFTMAHSMESNMEDEIETLEVIEITGTVMEQAPRDIRYPLPKIPTPQNLQIITQLPRPELQLVKQTSSISRILLDQTAKTDFRRRGGARETGGRAQRP